MGIKKTFPKGKDHSQCFEHGGNISQEAKRLGLNENNLLDASASIVPFKHSHEILNCIKKSLEGNELRTYPDRYHLELKESIGKWHSIHPSMVLPGNGASELITWAARDASQYGTSTLPIPGFQITNEP